MKPHASPIIINSYLVQSRRETELMLEAHNARVDEALRTPAGLRVFWLSCEPRFAGVTFEVAGRPGGPWGFKGGRLLSTGSLE